MKGNEIIISVLFTVIFGKFGKGDYECGHLETV